jgi:serine/threonine-protein kinase
MSSPSETASTLLANDATGAAREPVAIDSAPGELVGQYRVLEAVAAGGFGVVHRIEHIENGHEAAIKILHAELAGNETLIRRFEREVQVMRLIHHPGMVDVLEVGQLVDGRPYFVMELLHGVTLREHIAARGRLPVDEVMDILAPLCDTLSAAHEKSVIHRDIKASNVFLSDRDGQRRVVLLDFGVAKLLDTTAPGLTASRHAVGTFACMAPEQLLCAPVDARTDVYALGALAFRMLTGHPPFEIASYLVMSHMHLHGRPPRPSTKAPVSAAFDEVILKAMAKSPAARQPSMTAFLDEMRAAVRSARGRAPGPLLVHATLRRVLAVRLETRLEGEVPEDAERLFTSMERLLPIARSWLTEDGLGVAMEAGTTLLFTVDRPDDPAVDRALRARLLTRVAELARRIDEQPDRDARVRADFCVHVSTALLLPDGTAAGGELLDFVSWVPEIGAGAVLASLAALEGLSTESVPFGETGGIAYVTIAIGAKILLA